MKSAVNTRIVILALLLASLACSTSSALGATPTVAPIATGRPQGAALRLDDTKHGPSSFSVCVDALNVRKDPNAQSSAVGWLHRGDAVTVSAWADGWGRVDGLGGWVNGRYLC